MKKQLPKTQGFTLIELLVVIAIIAVLVVVVLPQLGNFNRSQSLQSAAAQLQSDFRATQNNAISGVSCNSTTPGVKATDWHLLIANANSYSISPTCIGSTNILHTLSSGVKIVSVSLDNCETLADTVSGSNLANFGAAFSNISGAVNFLSGSVGCPASSFTKQLIIILQLNGDNQRLKLIIEKGGAIYLTSV